MDLTTPQTPVAVAAKAFVTEASPAFLNGHVFRTFHFGRALTDVDDYDIEATYVASLFHDLSLVDGFGGNRSFELVGAEHAARWLEGHSWDLDRIALVEQAIIRHVELDPVGGPEVRFVHLGAALDVAGARIDEIDPTVIDAILAAYPRTGMVENITAAFLAELAAQPDGAFADLAAAVPFTEAIAANPLNDRG